jgi:hypothetical protein
MSTKQIATPPSPNSDLMFNAHILTPLWDKTEVSSHASGVLANQKSSRRLALKNARLGSFGIKTSETRQKTARAFGNVDLIWPSVAYSHSGFMHLVGVLGNLKARSP